MNKEKAMERFFSNLIDDGVIKSFQREWIKQLYKQGCIILSPDEVHRYEKILLREIGKKIPNDTKIRMATKDKHGKYIEVMEWLPRKKRLDNEKSFTLDNSGRVKLCPEDDGSHELKYKKSGKT